MDLGSMIVPLPNIGLDTMWPRALDKYYLICASAKVLTLDIAIYFGECDGFTLVAVDWEIQ